MYESCIELTISPALLQQDLIYYYKYAINVLPFSVSHPVSNEQEVELNCSEME